MGELDSSVSKRDWPADYRFVCLVCVFLRLRLHLAREIGQAFHCLRSYVHRYMHWIAGLVCFYSWRRWQSVVSTEYCHKRVSEFGIRYLRRHKCLGNGNAG